MKPLDILVFVAMLCLKSAGAALQTGQRLSSAGETLRAHRPSVNHDRDLEDQLGINVPTEDVAITDAPTGAEPVTAAPTARVTDEGFLGLDLRVYKEFTDGYKFGFITDYNKETSTYTVTYDDDEAENYPLGSTELENIVGQAKDYVGYKAGTAVLREETESTGKIISFDSWIYVIEWENEGGLVDRVYNMTEVVMMVDAAIRAKEQGTFNAMNNKVPSDYKTTLKKSGVSTSGQDVVEHGSNDSGSKLKPFSIVVVVAAMGALFFVFRRRRALGASKRFRTQEIVAPQYSDRNLHETDLSRMT